MAQLFEAYYFLNDFMRKNERDGVKEKDYGCSFRFQKHACPWELQPLFHRKRKKIKKKKLVWCRICKWLKSIASVNKDIMEKN